MNQFVFNENKKEKNQRRQIINILDDECNKMKCLRKLKGNKMKYNCRSKYRIDTLDNLYSPRINENT